MMRSRWFVVLVATIMAHVGAATPIAQAGIHIADTTEVCIFLDVNGSPYYAPCNGDEVEPPGIPPASPPECVPSPDPCP